MLRNCLKKGFRPVAVLTVAVLMCSLGGCSDSESGWLEGRAFTMNAYSNTGELTLTSHAEKIGLADNADIDVELDCDEIVFEWSDADDSQTCNLPPCYGGHRLQTDMTAYDLLLELGVIDDPYARNKERD